jgi:hypothetical protein
MKSNDTILLEKAYENILNRRFINENHDSNFKLDMDGDMAKALGDEIYSLPKQNFTDAIDNGSLKEMSWYLRCKGDGRQPLLMKIVDFEDDIITIEDKYRSYLNKYIEPVNEKIKEAPAYRGIKYQISDDRKERGDFHGDKITPDEIIIGPIEEDEMVYNLIQYIDKLEARSRSMHSYFTSHPDAPMD